MRIVKLVFSFIISIQSHAQIVDFEHVDFSKADSIAISLKKESLKNLPDLSYKLTSGLPTDVEKFRAIFKWISTNLSNDYGLYLKNKKKRHRFKDDSLKLETWNSEFKKVLFRKMVKNKKTICTGYAYLLKELADLSGLNCEIVHGFGKTSTTPIDEDTAPNHSWNVIKLNGKWYLADPTWASGIPDPETNRFQFYFNEGYFLASPKLYAVNHYPIKEEWILMNDQKPSFVDFLNAPIIYGGAYNYLVSIDSPTKMHNEINKTERIKFEYQLIKPVNEDSVRLIIDNGYASRTISPLLLKIEENDLTFEYQFNSTGFYDVHVTINDKLISTHTVKVR